MLTFDRTHCATLSQVNVEILEPRRLLAATMVRDIGPGAMHSHPAELTVAGERLYFVVDTHSTGLPLAGWFGELWSTDGTSGGTKRLTSIPNRASGTTGSRFDARPESALPFYNGPRSLIAVGDTLWYYDVSRISSQQLQVQLRSFTSSGPGRSYDLGGVNLSLDQHLHDPQIVNGRIFIYRDAEFWNPDPERQEGKWWTINDSGALVPTNMTSRNAISGDGPAYSVNSQFRGRQYFVHNDGVNGRELWRNIDPPADGILRMRGTGGNDSFAMRRQLGSSDVLILLNNTASTYRPGELDQVRVSLGDGNDRATINETSGKISIPVSIHGGAGNDLLMGASGRDTLYGGDGHDTLYGGAENDYLFGQAGNDRLAGGGGRDVLWGDAGRDTFVQSILAERRDAGGDDDLS